MVCETFGTLIPSLSLIPLQRETLNMEPVNPYEAGGGWLSRRHFGMDKEEKMVLNRTVLFCVFGAFLCMTLFGGCGKQTPKEAKDQATLEGVSLQYWTDRLVQRDYKAAYNREVENASMSFEAYRGLVSRNENFTFSGLAIEKATIENDDAIVYVGLKCLVPNLPQAIDRTFKDQWIYQSGQWKHQFSKTQP
jgi:hypothetical protein